MLNKKEIRFCEISYNDMLEMRVSLIKEKLTSSTDIAESTRKLGRLMV